MNLKQNIKGLWDNKQIIHAKDLHVGLIIVLFIITVILISIPNYFGLLNGLRDIDQIKGLETAFQAMYDQPIPSHITEDAKMMCDETNTNDHYGDYRFVYQETIDTSDISISTIYMGETTFAMIYIDESDQAYLVTGNYQLLASFDFTTINQDATGDLVTYQNRVTDIFISSIYNSTVNEKIVLIFITQFSQALIYLVILTFMIMIVNFRSKIHKITFMAANKIVIASMLGPALLSAIVGIFLTGWGSILFTILFAIRMMFVYYQIHRTTEPIF